MKNKLIKIFRWTLRVLSGLLIVLALSMLIYYRLFPEGEGEPLSTDAILGLSIWGIGFLGLGLAWKWELIGSIISLIAFVGAGIDEPGIWTNPSPLYIWPATAILFIVL